jgi:hypothetical protein
VPFGDAPSESTLSTSLASSLRRHPRCYSEELLLLIALVRTLWWLSYQDMHAWLAAWPALALACVLPLEQHGQTRILNPSQQ